MSTFEPTVCGIVAAYLRHLALTDLCCPESLKERQRTLGGFAAVYGALPVSEAKPYHLRDWIEGNGAWQSTATRKAKANQVNAAFNWAQRDGRIGANPFKAVKYAEAQPRPPMPDSVMAAVANKANKRYERAVVFLRLTGCRLSELARIALANVHWAEAVIVLDKHKARKKTGKPRLIALVPEAAQLLREIASEFPADYTGALFLNNRNRAWTKDAMGQQLRRMKRRGLVSTPASLHGIRHEFATEALRNGAALKAVSLQLGHSSTRVTELIYCHVEGNVEYMREAARCANP